ncbi:MAG: ribosome-associated translation inhibitor RaiA [Planctomycetota bacterium]|nr:ribosome-associated translation inhibitor RaiA [Planctomycetota bacterium]
MLFTISGRHVDVPEAVRKHAEEKTSKLPRYYDSINQIEVIIGGGQSGAGISVEIIARAEHGKVFVVSQTGEDVYRCIDFAVRKLEQQLKRRKSKERDNKRTGGAELT